MCLIWFLLVKRWQLHFEFSFHLLHQSRLFPRWGHRVSLWSWVFASTNSLSIMLFNDVGRHVDYVCVPWQSPWTFGHLSLWGLEFPWDRHLRGISTKYLQRRAFASLKESSVIFYLLQTCQVRPLDCFGCQKVDWWSPSWCSVALRNCPLCRREDCQRKVPYSDYQLEPSSWWRQSVLRQDLQYSSLWTDCEHYLIVWLSFIWWLQTKE